MEFDNLDTYISLAKKIIAKFGSSMFPALSKEMLKNEDAISDVATAIMYADWRWDNNRKGYNGQAKTKYSYRNQCAIWAIKTYITQKRKNKKIKAASCLDKEESSYISQVPDNIIDPQDYVSDKEQQHNLSLLMDNILSSGILNDKQKKQIILYYYQNKTLAEIGDEYGVTREAVRQNIQKGLKKIQEYV